MITDAKVRSELRRLAIQGRLMDEAFKVFQRTCLPGQTPGHVAQLRIAFFAGAAELVALLGHGCDDTDPDQTSAAEEAMVMAVFDEVTAAHDRVVRLALSKPEGRA